MADIQSIPGVRELWSETLGDPEIRIAILDGAADLGHECFQGADLTLVRGATSESGATLQGFAREHGTHIASILLGQHSSTVPGLAPKCRGYLIPVFSDDGQKLSQLELARAIERALELGAHVINISGGQLSQDGEAHDMLEKAVRSCAESNVLVVAAAGNDGCDCLHVPASLPSVVAVGALDDKGDPLDFSNWGEAYRSKGVLAPGENILGAKDGGGTVRRSGTSLATPIVSGVAALLLSLQLKKGRKPDPAAVRAAILQGADPCEAKGTGECDRFLAGKLNVSKAVDALLGSRSKSSSASGGGKMSSLNESPNLNENLHESPAPPPVESLAQSVSPSGCHCQGSSSNPPVPSSAAPGVSPGIGPSHQTGAVYVLGTLGYDFGTEARRDSFKQLMPPVIATINGKEVPVPSNPYDARQMVAYLAQQPSEARSLIWTLSLELTPIYAIEPAGPYGADVYKVLVDQLAGETLAEGSPEYVERVSIPAVLTGRTVRLFSGQHVPVISLENTRGVYGWQVNALIDSALKGVHALPKTAGVATVKVDENLLRANVRDFLNRLYYDLRNLGVTSPDRALNFAATNIFQAVQTFAQAIGSGKTLDGIAIVKSPFCRLDSDCWDVKLRFFDPENTQRARSVFRFTIDVSDTIPVTLGRVVSWSESD